MSGIPAWATFLNDSNLQQYFLDGVVSKGKTLGVGSYGSVFKVEYRQVACAAKCMHELLLDPGNDGATKTIETYRRECQLMAGLRHPNITQFLGLCFLEGSSLPLIVLERLKMNVDDLLENTPAIPLSVKISILTDTCSGLVYLHSMKTPIVHRDLTARNVLLSSSLTAKITDLGNSRMVTFKPGQLAQTLTKAPGTTVYMPPEALDESHKYGPSLDVFSFGHLALFTLNQKFPGELLSANYPDPNNPGHLIGRTEVERRGVYMRNLDEQFIGSYPVLVQLVTQSLHNNPQARPSSQELLEKLQAIKHEVEDKHGGSMGVLLDLTSILLLKEMKMKDKEISRLQASKAGLEARYEEKIAANRALEEEKRSLIAANRALEEEKRSLIAEPARITSEQLQDKHEKPLLTDDYYKVVAEKANLEAENYQLKSNNEQLQIRYDECKAINIALENEIKVHRQVQQNCKKCQAQHQKSHLVNYPLELDWRRGPDMPVAMGRYIQAVEINGIVYVGGGETARSVDDHLVMTYTTQTCQWQTLPLYDTKGFAMAAVNSKLVLVGGQARNFSDDSNELGEWQPDKNQWTHPFPPLRTPRYEPSATTYKHWLVVAGGCHGDCLRTVEVLDTFRMQWSTGPCTPVPWHHMKSISIEDTLYLMGGNFSDYWWDTYVYSVSLKSLISFPSSNTRSIWKKLPSLNCGVSCPLSIGRSLLAVGGWDNETNEGVSTIQRYVPEDNTWVQAGQLPHVFSYCTCIIVQDKIHLIGGWDGMTRFKELYTSTYY